VEWGTGWEGEPASKRAGGLHRQPPGGSWPIAAFCSIPFRLYAWTIADMVDEEKAAAWLKWDFVERTLELKPPVSAWVATLMSKIYGTLLALDGLHPGLPGQV